MALAFLEIFQAFHIIYASLHLIIATHFTRWSISKGQSTLSLLVLTMLSAGLFSDNMLRSVSPAILFEANPENLSPIEYFVKIWTGISYFLHGFLPSWLFIVAQKIVISKCPITKQNTRFCIGLSVSFVMAVLNCVDFVHSHVWRSLELSRSFGVSLFRSTLPNPLSHLPLITILISCIIFLIISVLQVVKSRRYEAAVLMVLVILGNGALVPPSPGDPETDIGFVKLVTSNFFEILFVLAIQQMLKVAFQQDNVVITKPANQAPAILIASPVGNLSDEIDDLAMNLAGIQQSSAPASPPMMQQQPFQPQSGTESPNQILIRKQILAIQQDQSLTPPEKARKIQLLMMPKSSQAFDTTSAQMRPTRNVSSRASLALSEVSGLSEFLNQELDISTRLPNALASRLERSSQMMDTESDRDAEDSDEAFEDAPDTIQLKSLIESQPIVHVSPAEARITFQDADSKTLGCEHYKRNCKIKAECCQNWHTCRLCHDDGNSHVIDRKAIRDMMCMKCMTCQPAAQSCQSCGESMAKYYCESCHLWDDDQNKNIYHCDKCGICRIGKGLDKDYFHCDKCNICLAINLKGNHKCIERNLECDCPICGEYMFTSMKTVIFMPCGHCIHYGCYQEHVKNSYQCPICWKSLADMTSFFRQIDRMLEEHKMPPEYENYWSMVLCNDCEKKSKTKYHFLYHKCQECNGYNTKILETYQEREGVGLVLSDTPLQQLSINTSLHADAGHMDVEELTDNSSARLRSSSSLSATAEQSSWNSSDDTE